MKMKVMEAIDQLYKALENDPDFGKQSIKAVEECEEKLLTDSLSTAQKALVEGVRRMIKDSRKCG